MSNILESIETRQLLEDSLLTITDLIDRYWKMSGHKYRHPKLSKKEIYEKYFPVASEVIKQLNDKLEEIDYLNQNDE